MGVGLHSNYIHMRNIHKSIDSIRNFNENSIQLLNAFHTDVRLLCSCKFNVKVWFGIAIPYTHITIAIVTIMVIIIIIARIMILFVNSCNQQSYNTIWNQTMKIFFSTSTLPFCFHISLENYRMHYFYVKYWERDSILWQWKIILLVGSFLHPNSFFNVCFCFLLGTLFCLIPFSLFQSLKIIESLYSMLYKIIFLYSESQHYDALLKHFP